MTVVSAARSDLSENTAFAERSNETIDAMVREVARSRPDAIVILCTNAAASFVAERLTHEFALPVLDSAAVALANSLDLLAPMRGTRSRVNR